MHQDWSARAAAAEKAVVARHLRKLWALPGTALGVVAWPAVCREKVFITWNYWWQAHLIDCAIDALERDQTGDRRQLARIVRGHRIRNVTGWTNDYYDDMAWLGIALERAHRGGFVDKQAAVRTLDAEVFGAWAPEHGGGIPWRKGSDFYNAPANGPAGILLARTGKVGRAQDMADWIDATLRDPATGLIFDGIHTDGRLERVIYSYCQGVTLGLETELAVRTGHPRHRERVHRLVEAVDNRLTKIGVIEGGGRGDGGLFNGILARYLALTAVMLPAENADDIMTRERAAHIVLASAESAWKNRLAVDAMPLFGHDWTKSAALPTRASKIPERDLSVQLGGWMLLEAAHRVSAADPYS
ncbi:MAG: fructose-bisphosphate aldolase [Rhodococcus sp.]|nr:fructose-bisphosphate aldolase [Rhodococcus sp. (in: high G+C Gram-positive bacteria)]